MPQCIDPLTTSSTESAKDRAALSALREKRISIHNIPNVEFYPAPQLAHTTNNDLYGEVPFGLFVLDHGIYLGASALIMTKAGELLIEQNAGIGTDVELMSAYCSTIKDKAPESGMAAADHLLSLISVSCFCFYHWMMDCLPKVVLAEMTGYTGKYLIPPKIMVPWAEESMQLLRIDPARLLTHDTFIVRCEKLYIPTYFSGFFNQSHGELISRYREILLKSCAAQPHAGNQHIFAPRPQTAKARRIVNQDEVATLLTKRRFTELYFENLTLKEQITRAASAETFIAPHGSAMVHSLFLKRRAKVIELFPQNGSSPCYQSNMKLLQHDYHAEFSHIDCGQDILVNTTRLEQLLC